MSELKAETIVPQGTTITLQMYPKSETDKVIAEKDAEIAELKDKLQNVSELLKETREWLIESQKLHKRCADNAIKTIRHQKYKQCMAMAKWCENALLGWMGYKESFSSHQRYIKVMLFTKWQKRWLALAEKFKEAK